MSEVDLQDIHENDLFNEVPLSKMGSFMDKAQNNEYDEGEVVLEEGEPGEGLYYIAQGSVKIMRGDDREIYVQTLGQGDFFGEMSLFNPQPVSASVVSRGDLKILFFPKEVFFDFIENEPAFAVPFLKTLVKHLCMRIRSTTDTLTFLKEANKPIDKDEIDELMDDVENVEFI